MLKKDLDIVLEEAPLIILNSKSAVCMANNDKDNKHTSSIYIIVHFLRNGEKCKIHKIDWWREVFNLQTLLLIMLVRMIRSKDEIY